MSAHTPGPWHVSGRHREFIDIEHSDNVPGAISAVLARAVARQSWSAEGEANARLIAAAPELLDALKVVLERFWPIRDELIFSKRIAIDKVRAAIAKATGEQE